MKKLYHYPLGLTFFGLTSEGAKLYRSNIFKQIHEIVFHGNGGYTWQDVYNMPIWLRNFTFNEIKVYHEKQDPNQSAEQSWLKGEAREEAKKNRKYVKPPSYK